MNIADMIERDRCPLIVIDPRDIDLSISDLRPGGIIRCAPNAVRYEAMIGAFRWEDARRVIEET